METLYVDGESGLNANASQIYMKREGIDLTIRAPNQHAQYIERRGAVLRHTMHTTEEQLKREGIAVTAPVLLGISLFSWNA